MKSGEDTSFRDKDGKAILIHSHVADSKGAVYYVNSFSQAVPLGDGAAIPLPSLMAGDSEIRLLSAEEALSLSTSSLAAAAARSDERPARKSRKHEELDLGRPRSSTPPPEEKPAEAAAPREKPAAEDAQKKDDPSREEVLQDLRLVIQTIPDRMLADELRRRGYVFSAVKPVIINI